MQERIYLVGFMGSGKTTVGRLLAARLGWDFVDLDAEIERRQGRSISEIFRVSGEAHFRRLESECLRLVSAAPHRVLALGGGTYPDPRNRAYIDAHGLSVYLETRLESILQRIPTDTERPLFSDPERVSELYQQRRPSYRMARMTIETDGMSPEAVVDRLMDLIRAS